MSLFDDLSDPAPTPLPPPPPPPPSAVNEKLLEVHRRLCAVYECPIPYFHHLDALSELVSSLLSHRTKNADSGGAFKALRAEYGEDWTAVRDAPVARVQELISAVTWPEQKAPRIQAVLREIARRRGGELSLDFLAGMKPADARAWLEELPGVGPKTSAAVLSFSSLRMRALPVDSHHHRVAARLGIISERLPVGASHAVLEAMLPADWDAQQVYDHHEVLMLHGQRCCFFANPACERCAVLELCPTGKARLKRAATADGRPPNGAEYRADERDATATDPAVASSRPRRRRTDTGKPNT
jgi:endonuclease-3